MAVDRSSSATALGLPGTGRSNVSRVPPRPSTTVYFMGRGKESNANQWNEMVGGLAGRRDIHRGRRYGACRGYPFGNRRPAAESDRKRRPATGAPHRRFTGEVLNLIGAG